MKTKGGLGLGVTTSPNQNPAELETGVSGSGNFEQVQ